MYLDPSDLNLLTVSDLLFNINFKYNGDNYE